jgi:hypothetical protein
MELAKKNIIYQGNSVISIETIPTQHSIKTTASRNVFLSKGIPMLLIVLLAIISSHICSKTFAEEQAVMNTRTDRTDQTV